MISSLNPAPSHTHPIDEKWVTIDNARMRYLRTGSGPPLLLVHGLLGYSFSWRFTIPAMVDRTVYAIDLLGTGFSERPANLDCSMRASAQRLLRFLDAVGVSSCDLLGTSHGGAVAVMAASLAPERFKHLILVAPVNPWSDHGKRLTRLLTNPLVAPWFFDLVPHLKLVHEHVLRRLYGDPCRIRPGTLEGYSAPLEISGSFRYALSVLRCWNDDLKELENALPRISHLPTLLMWGNRDIAVSLASAQRLREQFRNCQLVVLDGVGHLPYEEAPEQFSAAVMKFLSAPENS